MAKPMDGELDIILGCMFSGKSTELIRRINRYKSIGKRVLVINYQNDNRYSYDSIATHDNTLLKCVRTLDLFSLINTIPGREEITNNWDVIAIDEGQFFPDLFIFCKECVDQMKKHVIVTALDGDYRRSKFGQVLDIIPICNSVFKLHALCKLCKDGTSACFTKRIDKGIDGNAPPQIDIGGSEKFVPVCRKHFLE